ncbi:MAG: hypothetical protein KKD28_05540 [Chloroflexi bacterium]|nr:hypothetical protein [Chloroflexota bacterium]
MSIFTSRVRIQRGMIFGLLIITALLSFELFNYSTTDFALTDLLGNLKFLGVRWATILSIAFCGIDFAGIARLFTPEQGADEPAEVWYLFGAWMLAAVMNAMLTWWGVTIAVLNHQTLGNAVVARATLIKVVPIFVAIMVWLIRVLIIGTLSMAGDRLFSQAEHRPAARRSRQSTQRTNTRSRTPSIRPLGTRTPAASRGVGDSSYRSAPKPEPRYTSEPDHAASEPTYSPVSFSSNREDRSRQSRF